MILKSLKIGQNLKGVPFEKMAKKVNKNLIGFYRVKIIKKKNR